MTDEHISEEAKSVVRSADELKSLVDLDFVIEKVKALYEVRKSIAEESDDVSSELEELEESRLANQILSRRDLKLKGPDATLLSGFYLLRDAELEQFSSRQVSRILRKHGREVSNITTTMNLLLKRGDCALVVEDGSAHRTYSLTNTGVLTARDLLAMHM